MPRKTAKEKVIKNSTDKHFDAIEVVKKTLKPLDDLIPINNPRHKCVLYITAEKLQNIYGGDKQKVLENWNKKYELLGNNSSSVTIKIQTDGD